MNRGTEFMAFIPQLHVRRSLGQAPGNPHARLQNLHESRSYPKSCKQNTIARWRIISLLASLVILAVFVVFEPAWAGQGTSSVDLSFLNPAGPVADKQRHDFIWVALITLIVVLPAIVLTPYLAWRYRKGAKKSDYQPKWEFSWPLEIVIWGIPAIIVILLAINIWHTTEELDPYKPLSSNASTVPINVIGLDWKWLFIYPEQSIATVGEMVIPKGHPVAINLTSDTVMQSFWIPALGSQIYAMAGMQTKLNLQADRTGAFRGLNTQYSGLGFEHQKFLARAVTDDAFKHWVKQVKANGIPLDAKNYAILSQRSSRSEAFSALGKKGMPQDVLYFSSVPTHFFDSIIKKYEKNIPPNLQPGAYAHGGAKDPSADGSTNLGTGGATHGAQ